MANGKPQRIILVAADDSEASEEACQWAIDNLVRTGDSVYITHVTQLPWGGSGRVIPIDAPLIFPEAAEDRGIQDSINATTDMLKKRFEPRLKHIEHKMEIVHYNKGAVEVGEAICDRAKALPAAAVVMASHNKGAIKRLFLGSTTAYCTKNCPVSLVITR